jgi:formylmethanofuran dehydrogenase subunit E
MKYRVYFEITERRVIVIDAPSEQEADDAVSDIWNGDGGAGELCDRSSVDESWLHDLRIHAIPPASLTCATCHQPKADEELGDDNGSNVCEACAAKSGKDVKDPNA